MKTRSCQQRKKTSAATLAGGSKSQKVVRKPRAISRTPKNSTKSADHVKAVPANLSPGMSKPVIVLEDVLAKKSELLPDSSSDITESKRNSQDPVTIQKPIQDPDTKDSSPLLEHSIGELTQKQNTAVRRSPRNARISVTRNNDQSSPHAKLNSGLVHVRSRGRKLVYSLQDDPSDEVTVVSPRTRRAGASVGAARVEMVEKPDVKTRRSSSRRRLATLNQKVRSSDTCSNEDSDCKVDVDDNPASNAHHLPDSISQQKTTAASEPMSMQTGENSCVPNEGAKQSLTLGSGDESENKGLQTNSGDLRRLESHTDGCKEENSSIVDQTMPPSPEVNLGVSAGSLEKQSEIEPKYSIGNSSPQSLAAVVSELGILDHRPPYSSEINSTQIDDSENKPTAAASLSVRCDVSVNQVSCDTFETELEFEEKNLVIDLPEENDVIFNNPPNNLHGLKSEDHNELIPEDAKPKSDRGSPLKRQNDEPHSVDVPAKKVCKEDDASDKDKSSVEAGSSKQKNNCSGSSDENTTDENSKAKDQLKKKRHRKKKKRKRRRHKSEHHKKHKHEDTPTSSPKKKTSDVPSRLTNDLGNHEEGEILDSSDDDLTTRNKNHAKDSSNSHKKTDVVDHKSNPKKKHQEKEPKKEEKRRKDKSTSSNSHRDHSPPHRSDKERHRRNDSDRDRHYERSSRYRGESDHHRYRASSRDKYIPRRRASATNHKRDRQGSASLEDLQQSTTLGALIAKRKKLCEKIKNTPSNKSGSAESKIVAGEASDMKVVVGSDGAKGKRESEIAVVSLVDDSSGSDMEISDIDGSDIEIITEIDAGDTFINQAEDSDEVEVITEVIPSITESCGMKKIPVVTPAMIIDDDETQISVQHDLPPWSSNDDSTAGDCIVLDTNQAPLGQDAANPEMTNIVRSARKKARRKAKASQKSSTDSEDVAEGSPSTSAQSQGKNKPGRDQTIRHPDIPEGMDPFQWELLRCRHTFWTRWGHDYYREYASGGMKRYMPTRIISYNLLSQDLMEHHPHLYSETKPCHTSWQYRSKNLLSELYDLDGDIYCLQEVHHEHYRDTYQPAFEKWGYQGVYKQRLHDKKDGCAIFFNTSKYQLEKSVPVEFYRPGVSTLDRDNIALIVSLIPIKKTGQACKNGRLIVATTHLLFNPKRGDIKLAQSMLLLAEIDKLAAHPSCMGSDKRIYHPVVITGDFNTQPNAPLYRLLLMGLLKYKDMPRACVSGQLPYGGFSPTLNTEIIPKNLGITDSCQYISELVSSQIQPSSAKRVEPSSVELEKVQQKLLETVVEEGETSEACDTLMEEDGKEAETVEEKGEKNKLSGLWTTLKACQDRDWKPASDWSGSGSRSSSGSPVPEQGTSKTKPKQPPSHSRTPSPVNMVPYKQCSGTLTHQLPLNTVYKHFVYERGDLVPEVTSHHLADMSSVDYILYTVNSCRAVKRGRQLVMTDVMEGKLKLVGSLALPTRSVLEKGAGPLPNSAVSSDHLALAADFVLDIK